jgi:organic hydroperoxide reductase OsmC/OhrA
MAHVFLSHLEWSGAATGPTHDAATFSRDLTVRIGGQTVPMSSAPAFHGDPFRVNPEELFVASLSACQALTYLYLAARNRIAVVGYSDEAQGELEMIEKRMRMSRVTLRPQIVLEPHADVTLAHSLVEKAHANCFIANSVAATVTIEPMVTVADVAVAASR